jgi:NADPH-dependent 2,4-dienoyl-CoA reductase/sulfur reductase-like enzyme
VPEQPVVLAGSGPLLLLLAWQYLQAGARIAALLDTTPRANYLGALRYLPPALGACGTLVKGLGLLNDIRRAGVTVVRGVEAIRALGEHRLEAIEYRRGGRKAIIDSELLMLHQGVVPNVQISRALGCQHLWDDQQLCWRPRIDRWGFTDIDGIAIAGDGAGIGGAMVAECQGRLTALEAARRQDRLSVAERDHAASLDLRTQHSHRRIRPFLDALYRPADAFRRPPDETIVCRCEEVTAGQIREMVVLGCTGPNQTKSFTRCGMGPCQGRMCGLTVSELIADARGVATSEVGYYRIRPPIKPITLGELAASAVTTDPEAVRE